MFPSRLVKPILHTIHQNKIVRLFSTSGKTLFEKIVSREIPADILFEDDKVSIDKDIVILFSAVPSKM